METFNFKFDTGNHLIIHSPLQIVAQSQDPKTFQWVNKAFTIPPTSILRIENITMGQYTKSDVQVVFAFLVRKNKHIKLQTSIPKRFTCSVYIEMNALVRKNKIEKAVAE